MTCVGVLLGPSGRCGLGISFGVKSLEVRFGFGVKSLGLSFGDSGLEFEGLGSEFRSVSHHT